MMISKIIFYSLISCICSTIACKSGPVKNVLPDNERQSDCIIRASTDKGSYMVNDQVKLNFSFTNENASVVTIDKIIVQVRNISMPSSPVVYEKKMESIIDLQPGQNYVINNIDLWKIPGNTLTNAYGIYLQYESEASLSPINYYNFFRVVTKNDFTTYRIDQSTYKGLNIYTLHGGMSAECVVEKAVENLKPAIAHSWYLNAPGSGPEHVLATPQFLQNSVKQTVDFYNKELGDQTIFETVVIGPGLEAIPYLSQALKAPVLPIHFLVSSNTVKEVQSILDYSNAHGYVSYATLGHDYSVPFAVAWVKLLEMPAEYLQFIKQHRVKNIVFTGYTGSEGENTAKKVANGATQSLYAPGSLFILYPGGGSEGDMKELKEKIIDFGNTAQQNDFIQIPDWESGIMNEQVKQYTKKAKEQAGIIDTRFITTKEMIHLWDLATYSATAFIYKNDSTFRANGGTAIKGVSVNPYFVANAFFESYSGFIPLIYWQHNSKEATVSRIKNVTTGALAAYFPEINLSGLSCWINSSNNFDGAANAKELTGLIRPVGFAKLIENDYTKDDIWNETDGMKAPVELRAVQLMNKNKSAAALKKWNNDLKALSLMDIDEMGKKFPLILVTKVD